MTIPEKVVGFLSSHCGRRYCDACIRKECALRSTLEAERITATLELFPEFLRVKAECSSCARSDRLTTCFV